MVGMIRFSSQCLEVHMWGCLVELVYIILAVKLLLPWGADLLADVWTDLFFFGCL